MPNFTVTLSDTHLKALDAMRKDNGAGLDRDQWVQFMCVRALENHALTMRDEVVEKLAALDDAGIKIALEKRTVLLDERAAEAQRIEEERAAKEAKLAKPEDAVQAEGVQNAKV